MAAQLKDFEFKMPIVRKVSREEMTTLLRATRSSEKPTQALKNLMAGKITSSSKKK